MKKNNKMVRTNFARHDERIRQGEATAFDGWLDAGFECVDKFGGNASAYAASAVSLRWTGKNTLSQTETTIRLYVGAVVRLAKKHGDRKSLVSAYDAVYESREISALLSLAKSGKKGKQTTKSSKAVALTKRQARKAWDESRSFDEFWELING
jgi:hypothetical protein